MAPTSCCRSTPPILSSSSHSFPSITCRLCRRSLSEAPGASFSVSSDAIPSFAPEVPSAGIALSAATTMRPGRAPLPTVGTEDAFRRASASASLSFGVHVATTITELVGHLRVPAHTREVDKAEPPSLQATPCVIHPLFWRYRPSNCFRCVLHVGGCAPQLVRVPSFAASPAGPIATSTPPPQSSPLGPADAAAATRR